MTAMLDVRKLCYTVDSACLLEAADFTAHAGSLTAIIGPNGAGKTTFLRAVAGLLPAHGTVRINGDLTATMPERNARGAWLSSRRTIRLAITISPYARSRRKAVTRIAATPLIVRPRTTALSTRPSKTPNFPPYNIDASERFPAASAAELGSPWAWRKKPTCYCSTNRRRISTCTTRNARCA